MEEALAHAPSHVEQPRHAMVTYIFILLLISFYLNMQYGYTLFVVVNVIGGLSSNSRKRLERLFNLRIVTEGTETYDVMQDCLRIARGVTVDHNLYVWSRQRRRMEDA